jgi:hypothetical protein
LNTNSLLGRIFLQDEYVAHPKTRRKSLYVYRYSEGKDLNNMKIWFCKFLSAVFFLWVVSAECAQCMTPASRLQQLCDSIEVWGQHYVNKLVYIGYPVKPDPRMRQDSSKTFMNVGKYSKKPRVVGGDARLNLLLLLSAAVYSVDAQLSTNSDNQGSSANDLVSYNNQLVCWSNESASLPFAPESAWVFYEPKTLELEPEEKLLLLYYVKDLIFEKPGPHGNKDNKIYLTKTGERIFVKNRHLKGFFDSLLMSYLTSKLGAKICPGQIVKIVPVIDGDELKIGSFEIKNYVGVDDPLNVKRSHLSLVLDVMDIVDRGRANVGYYGENKVACAVDVDLGGFGEGDIVDQNKQWIHRIREKYHKIDQEFKSGLEAITNFSYDEFVGLLNEAESELHRILPPEHSIVKDRVLGERYYNIIRNRALNTWRQMRWVSDNFDMVSKIINDERKQVALADIIDDELIHKDDFGFFMYEAIERADVEMMKKLSEKSGNRFVSIFIYASLRVKNKAVLEALLYCCDKNPNYESLKGNVRKTLKDLGWSN